jgi:hypothetical protein
MRAIWAVKTNTHEHFSRELFTDGSSSLLPINKCNALHSTKKIIYARHTIYAFFILLFFSDAFLASAYTQPRANHE